MKNTPILFFLFFIPGALFAKTDSLFYLSDLHYHSNFEEQSFLKFLAGEETAFHLYLAIEESINMYDAQKLDEIYHSMIKELIDGKIESKKIEKKVSLIQEAAAENFLHIYQNFCLFNTTISSGMYNNMTAIMLYALIFDDFSIKYKVMDASDHFYLVVDPGPNSMLVEAYDPNVEVEKFSKFDKKEKINELLNYGELTQKAFDQMSLEEVFELQLSDAKQLPVTEFAGIQYFIKAKTAFDTSDYNGAFELLKKAYIFYPDEKVENLLSGTLGVLIDRSDFTRMEDVDLLAQFSKLNVSGAEIVSEIFQKVIRRQLNAKADKEHCDSLFIELKSSINDEDISEEISFRYNMLMSIHFQDSLEAESYIKEATRLRRDNIDLRKLMDVHFHNYLRKLVDSPVVLYSELKRIKNDFNYSFLNDVLGYYEILATLQLSELYTQEKRFEEAENYLNIFETIWNAKLRDQNIDKLIVRAFRSLAVANYYNGKKLKAKEIVDRGLVYIPGNSYLKSVVY